MSPRLLSENMTGLLDSVVAHYSGNTLGRPAQFVNRGTLRALTARGLVKLSATGHYVVPTRLGVECFLAGRLGRYLGRFSRSSRSGSVAS